MVKCPPWIRLPRVVRDIPTSYIQAGNMNPNLRQIINDELAPALAYPEQYVGMNQNDKGELTEIFLQKNGLHIIGFFTKSRR